MPPKTLKPRVTYCGLTVVMSNPSRHDTAELLSGTAGWFFREQCLRPNFNIFQCEVRLKEDRSPLLPNTKCVLLFGLDAYNLWIGNDKNNTLGEIRGSIFYDAKGIPHIPTYLPQDAMDVKDYESEHNVLLASKDYDEPSAELKSAKAEKRRHGITSRSNWRFWLKQDVNKACRIVLNRGKVPEAPFQPHYVLYPQESEIIQVFRDHKDTNMYIDIETDANYKVKCVGVSYDKSPIYVVPWLTHNYTWPYHNLLEVVRAFAVSLGRNTVVSHNGSQFDWLVLAWQYGIPWSPRLYDTMLAGHRVYTDIEKSLGHYTSLYTYEPFHKDEGSGAYSNEEQARKLWQYCGKDVYTMMLIKRAIDEFALTVPGLTQSIAQVNDSIPAYMLMTMMGMRYKQEMLNATMLENDRLMTHYLRWVEMLVGDSAHRALNKSSKKGMPGSNAKCCSYFYDMLGYKPVGKFSKKTNKPSLNKKNMLMLRLAHENPVIDIIMAYRELSKESGSLKFTDWNHTRKELVTDEK